MSEEENVEYFIESLWVIQNSGILIFEENYIDFRKEGMSTDLISSFLAAIVSFTDEAFADEIQHIQFSNRRIVFKFTEYVLLVVAISDKSHTPDFKIKRIIDQIAESFYTRFGEIIGRECWANDIGQFGIFSEDLKKIVKREPIKAKFLQFFDNIDFKDGFKKVEKFIKVQASVLSKQKERFDKFVEVKKSKKRIKKLLEEKNKLENKHE